MFFMDNMFLLCDGFYKTYQAANQGGMSINRTKGHEFL